MDGIFTKGSNDLKRSFLGTQRGREMDNPRGRARDFCSILRKRNLSMILGLCIREGEKVDFRENMGRTDRALEIKGLDDAEVWRLDADFILTILTDFT